MPLFWTQFLGAFNDNFLKNALVMLVTFRTATVLGMPYTEIVALAGGLFILPFLLFSALAGQLADKYEKTTIIRYVKGAEILIMFLATYGLLTEQFAFSLGVLFLMGLHSTFFGPIKYSILPQHLHAKEMLAGNALVEAGTFLAILLGTIGGSVLILFESGPLIVSMGLNAMAVIGFVTCLWIPRAPSVDSTIRIELNPIGPSWRMIGFARQNRSVMTSILGISWFWFFGACMLSVFPALCKDVLNATENVPPLFLAMFSLGIGAGSMLCERLSRHRLELGLIIVGAVGVSIFTVGLYWLSADYGLNTEPQTISSFLSPGRGLVILIDLFLLSVFGGIFTVPLYTLVQTRSAPQQRSRIVAANNIINALFMVVASLLLIVLFRIDLTIPEIILVIGVMNAFAAAALCYLHPEFLHSFIRLLRRP